MFIEMKNVNLNRVLIFGLMILLLCGSGSLLKAQDIHFSQYYLSPLTLSASETGNYDYEWRLMNNYRRQWNAVTIPYETVSVGFDKPFELNKNNKIAVGFLYLNDQSGGADLNINKFFLSTAWHHYIKNHALHIGIQGGAVSKAHNLNSITFPNQFDNSTGYYNSNLPDYENGLGDKVNYYDFNAGLSYDVNLGNLKPYLGVSFFHLTSINENFTGTEYKLPFRYAVHGGTKIGLGRFYLMPGVFYMQQNVSSEMLSGTNFGMEFIRSKNLQKIYVGAYFRNDIMFNTDAAVVTAGIDYKQFTFGVSYDFNISDLSRTSNYKGGLEFSLILKGPSVILEQIIVPCDRY